MPSGGRQAALGGGFDTASMIRCLVAAITLAAVFGATLLATREPAHARQASATTLELVRVRHGEYRVEVRHADALGPYVVRALVSGIGTDQGWVVDLEESDAPDLTFDLTLPLMRMEEGGCYRVSFFFGPQEWRKATPPQYETAPAIESRACMDDGVVNFPSHDNYRSLAPAPPTDVRLIDQGGGSYGLEWTDNSHDEVSFAVGIILRAPESRGGYAIGELRLPDVHRDDTSIGSIGFLFAPDGPDEPECGTAQILVYAVGGDVVSSYPGVLEAPACFGRGTISFPDTGHGGAEHAGPSGAIIALLAIGCGALIAGAAIRRRVAA